MKRHNQILNLIVNLDFIVSGIALCLLILLTFLGVFFRYILNNPIQWQEEVQMMLFVWVIFSGGGVAVRTGSHVAIDILVDLFPKALQKIVEWFIVVVIVGVLGYLTFKSAMLIGQLSASVRLTNILRIPIGQIYTIVPIGCVLMAVNFCAYYYRKLFLGRDTEEDDNE